MTKKNTHVWTYSVYFCNWTNPETGKFHSRSYGKTCSTREEAEAECKVEIMRAQHCYFNICDAAGQIQECWLLGKNKKWKMYSYATKKREIIPCG